MKAAFVTLLPSAAKLSWLLAVSARAVLLLAASWLGAVLLRRATAAARHQIWTLGVLGTLALPLLCGVLPALSLTWEPRAIGAGRTIFGPAIVVSAGDPTSTGPSWPAWVALTWAAGALLLAVRFLRGHLAARRRSHDAEPAHADSWRSAWLEATASLGIARKVGLYRSEALGSPMTVGVLRPRVLLPAAADAWSPQRLHAVLVHELGHVGRHDLLIQLAAQLVCVLCWWNPLAWLAAARLRIEREHACDDLVLAAGVRPSSYATDLLEVARAVSPDGAAQPGAASVVDLSWTEARLRRILDPAAPRRPPGAWFRRTVRGTTLALAVTLAGTAAHPAEPAPSGPTRMVATAGPTTERPSRAREAAEKDPRGKLWLGPPIAPPAPPLALVAEAPRDLALVTKEVESHLDHLRQCYQRRLLTNPDLEGVVVMHWAIAPTGEVTEQCITQDTLQDPEVVACVNELLATSRFPRSDGGAVDVSFPFVFGLPEVPGC